MQSFPFTHSEGRKNPSCKGTFQFMLLIGIKELLLQRGTNSFLSNHCRIYIAQVATDGKLLFWGAKVRLD